tara:strand:- start:1596 stop:1784 length:189 start_codon:yes stop_codon:yes gene_type:complete
MDNYDICDDEFSLDDDLKLLSPNNTASISQSILDSRRRIEELRELSRLRKLLDDDELVLDLT